MARLVIRAVTVEHRSIAEVCAAHGVSRSWVYELLARFRAEGERAFEARSRAPRTSPRATPPSTVDLVLDLRARLTRAGHDAGPDTIAWHLARHHGVTLSRATIHRILGRHGRIVPEPKKRPRSSLVTATAELPNELWQMGVTVVELAGPGGTTRVPVRLVTWLDDCSRCALHVSAHEDVTVHTVLATLRAVVRGHGFPLAVLFDSGDVQLDASDRDGGHALLAAQLRDWGVACEGLVSPRSTTGGKVRRFQVTVRKWLRAQPAVPSSVPELQLLLDRFRREYNTERPHRSLPGQATPRAHYDSLPAARGGRPGDAPSREK